MSAKPAHSEERAESVRAWYDSEYERAYEVILAAHPEAADGTRHSGEIWIHRPQEEGTTDA